ncbi:PREDICTED: uncharacterized protein LOC109464187 [Branchiostoma belcheri]|uniref:Uncharacterized protein LOC109464187 n=1 Tax=Branchiostoma belcheri TaxID=7741 RepID=A0A6P4XJH4_BRABE|nr:PREDICTED: uncharacterized protein LOC109464187 [Branchiostoma belcheri]
MGTKIAIETAVRRTCERHWLHAVFVLVCLIFPPVITASTKFRTDNRCGQGYLAANGNPAECPIDSNPCCSEYHWCGHTAAFCDCQNCVDYRKPSNRLTLKTNAGVNSGTTDSITVGIVSDVCVDVCATTTVSGLTAPGTQYNRAFNASDFGDPTLLRLNISGTDTLNLDWIDVYNAYTGRYHRFACLGNCPLSTDRSRGFKNVDLGVDLCPAGRYGFACTHLCHCANGPAACDQSTGACTGGCLDLWTGDSCHIRKDTVSYEDLFTKEEGRFFGSSAHNIASYSNIDVEECARRCLQGYGSYDGVTPTCLSFNHRPAGSPEGGSARCWLSSSDKDTAASPGPEWDSWPYRNYYQRKHIVAPQDCTDLFALGIRINSQAYTIGHPQPFKAYCDMSDIDGGGWTAIQYRKDGSVPFNRTWTDYEQGFGNASGEYWLGLGKIHSLTTRKRNELFVYLEDWEKNTRFARYSTFSVGDASSKYTAAIRGYSGTSTVTDSLDPFNSESISNRQFSTIDQDNDGINFDCAGTYGQGGWWYPPRCGYAFLNGQYLTGCSVPVPVCPTAEGIVWSTWLGDRYSLKETAMMIRPTDFPESTFRPCENGGTLMSGPEESGLYICACLAEWDGAFCNQRTTEQPYHNMSSAVPTTDLPYHNMSSTVPTTDLPYHNMSSTVPTTDLPYHNMSSTVATTDLPYHNMSSTVATTDLFNRIMSSTVATTDTLNHNMSSTQVTLDLSNKNISFIDPDIFKNQSNLHNVNLSNNQISNLNGSIFAPLVNLEVLDLSNNVIAIVTADAFSNLLNLKQIDLSKNSLTDLPDNTFVHNTNMETLHLDGNNISSIRQGVFNGLSSLRQLFLNNSGLSVLHSSSFAPLRSVEEIYLQGNDIRHLPVNTFQGLMSLTFVNLQGVIFGSFRCGCNVLKPQICIGSNVQSVSFNFSISCSNDTLNCNAHTVSEHCQQDQGDSHMLFAIPAGIILATALLVLYRYRTYIQAVLYTKCHWCPCWRADNTGKTYDAFISYSIEDINLVVRELAPGLEERGFELCLDYRDFPAGACIATTILESVEASRHTIIILSQSFVDSEWCALAFKAAHLQMLKDKQPRIVAIAISDETLHKVDKDLRFFLNTNECLVWGEAQFWSKLTYALSRGKQNCIHNHGDGEEVIIPDIQMARLV